VLLPCQPCFPLHQVVAYAVAVGVNLAKGHKCGCGTWALAIREIMPERLEIRK
jgi:hypothetical protein